MKRIADWQAEEKAVQARARANANRRANVNRRGNFNRRANINRRGAYRLAEERTGQAMATLAAQFPKPVGRRTDNWTRDIDDNDIVPFQLPGDLSLVRPIGAGSYGQVWLVKNQAAGTWWALKRIIFPTWEQNPTKHVKGFQDEVRYQKKFASIRCAPAIDSFWYTHGPYGTASGGCIKMQPIDGIVAKIAKDKQGDSDLLGYLASQILQLYNRTRQAGLGHGDPHFENIAIELSVDRKVPSLKYIDFGRSFTIPRIEDMGAEAHMFLEDADRFWVWRACCIFSPSLHRHIVAVGFPGSTLMEMIVGVGKPAPGTVSDIDDTPTVKKLMLYQDAAKAL